MGNQNGELRVQAGQPLKDGQLQTSTVEILSLLCMTFFVNYLVKVLYQCKSFVLVCTLFQFGTSRVSSSYMHFLTQKWRLRTYISWTTVPRIYRKVGRKFRFEGLLYPSDKSKPFSENQCSFQLFSGVWKLVNNPKY